MKPLLSSPIAGKLCFPGLFALLLSFASLSANAADWTIPTTPQGYPDLQGLWTNPSQTPFERPEALGTQRAYNEAEAQALMDRARELDTARALPLDPDRAAPEAGGMIDQQADGNFESMPIELARVNGEYRTSLMIDPPNGRLPYRAVVDDIYAQWRARGFGPYDGPEIMAAGSHCISGSQLPLLFPLGSVDGDDFLGGNPAGDNPVRNIQIVQTEDHVVIFTEYFSAVRIIRVSSEHMDNQGAKWMGDSIAHYEGNSLKIHTRNFRPEQSNFFLRSSDELEITETFTATAQNELLYSYTVNDPKIYQQSFSVEIPLTRMAKDQQLYEFACHEGDYSTPAILRAARLGED